LAIIPPSLGEFSHFGRSLSDYIRWFFFLCASTPSSTGRECQVDPFLLPLSLDCEDCYSRTLVPFSSIAIFPRRPQPPHSSQLEAVAVFLWSLSLLISFFSWVRARPNNKYSVCPLSVCSSSELDPQRLAPLLIPSSFL